MDVIRQFGVYSLRPLGESDLRMLLDWRNSDRVHSKMLSDHTISWEEHCGWFLRAKDYEPKRNFIFCYKEMPVGYIGYTEYDAENASCSPGCYLGVTEGIPSESGFFLFYAAIEYAFSNLGMMTLETSVFSDNREAIKLDEFLGYRRILGKDESVQKAGTLRTVFRYGMDKVAWNERKKKVSYILGL